jgi:hypothetical protein
MEAKSSEPMAEALRMQRQFGEVTPLPPSADSAFAGTAEDLGELFLAELRSRRERLAKWLELLQAEAHIETAPVRAVHRPRHRCRARAACHVGRSR